MFHYVSLFFFFFNDTATTEIYTLSLHDALPISWNGTSRGSWRLSSGSKPTFCKTGGMVAAGRPTPPGVVCAGKASGRASSTAIRRNSADLVISLFFISYFLPAAPWPWANPFGQ